jgi:L-asparaginase II
MQNPILVEIYRGEMLESFHRGVVCIVNHQGDIVFSAGDAMQLCYPRSAMKLFQVIPLLLHNGMQHFGFTLEEIAIMCGSHNGEEQHVNTVQSILHKIGLSIADLQCGSQYPTDKKSANQLIQRGQKPLAIHNNCSGKHAGMLAACLLLGFSTEDYIMPNHPLQQMIQKVCADMYEYSQEQMTIALDGCSAPIFSAPVYHQALGYKNLVNPQTQYADACKTIIQAVSNYPFMVAGSNRYCTDMMQLTAPQVIGKTGAEGIFCMTFTANKLGVCIKIDDGKMQPQYAVAQAIIEDSGLFSNNELANLHLYAEHEITNFNKLVTGKTTVSKEFIASLQQALGRL